MVHSHSIYVISADSKLNDSRHELLGRILNHIAEGYAVAYVGDESETAIVQYFSDRGVAIDQYIDRGLLTIINRDLFYSPFVPPKILLEQWSKLLASIEKKAGKGAFKGFVAMGMPADSFFISNLDNQQLVSYESLAANKYDGSLEAMCIYTTEMLQKMALRHVISLLNAHQNTGHKGGALREWNTKRGLEILKKGLDSALGPNVTEMILAIIIRDFEMKEEEMVLNPDQFERKLAILLGESAAEAVVNEVKSEIVKEVAY